MAAPLPGVLRQQAQHRHRAARADRPGQPVFDNSRARVLGAGRPLLLAAQQSREVRDDLTLEQVLDLVIAVSTIRGGPGYLKPILQATLDGIRRPAA